MTSITTEKYDVIVIGGGAAGMMAAGQAAERGRRVLLLEKNRKLGEKLKISGGGRCNITNAEDDVRTLLKAYGKAEPFLHSLFANFGVRETFSFFESKGLPLVVQDRKRVFPQTQKAADVCKTLEAYLRQVGVTVKTGSPVTAVVVEEKKITSVMCGDVSYCAETYILATGGVSHPETGSTGDGLRWLTDIGHTVLKPTPSIVPLKVEEKWVKELAGVSLSPMKITFFADSRKQFAEIGKILFTHFGISGPLILNSAHKIADLLHTASVTAHIDLYPKQDLGELERHVISIFDSHKNKTLKNVLKEVVPEGMSRGLLTLLEDEVYVATPVHSITREQRKKLVHTLKALPLTITGLMGFDRAVVADGGVPLEEIDMRTMRSNKISNLFITGDLLHINRPSGGFSLQLCWSSGYVAGSNA